MSSPVTDLLATASGREHRADPVLPTTGGPAGNASMTAWLGLLLLPLFAIQAITLLSLHSLLGVHLFVGAFLLPLVLAKTISTGYRVVRYYTGHDAYLAAGPPPTLLRLLGPLVVLTGLAVLGTGIALIALGPAGTFTQLFSVLGFSVSAMTLHQVTAIAWAVATGAHLLMRLVPALRLTVVRHHRTPTALPGIGGRLAALTVMLAVAVGTGLVVLHFGHGWEALRSFRHGPKQGIGHPRVHSH